MQQLGLFGKRSFNFALLIFISCSSIFAQTNPAPKDSITNKYVVSFLPSRSPNSYGLQIGPVGSESVCGYPYYKTSNGINIQIFGQGVLWMFYPINSYKSLNTEIDTTSSEYLKQYDALRAKHNGLLFSTFGAIQTRVNGVSVSLFYGQGTKLNGIAFNLLRNEFNVLNGVELGVINEAGRINGVQIGLINLAKEVKGFQFGLWNVNQKRKLPFINWGF